MKKRFFIILISYIILTLCVIGIIKIFSNETENNDEKIQIIVTLFPEYDFAQKIGGDKVEILLLLNSGVDIHSYEPSVKDMKNISDSDIFIYTSESTEPWAESIIDGLENEIKVVKAAENIELINLDEFSKNYNALSNENHEHNEDAEEYEYDGHVWLDPQNAIIMIDNICESLCEFDPANSEYYIQNAESYKIEIEELDNKIEEKIASLENKVLVFGGEFAYSYFIKRYNLKYVSVYSSCGEEAEPSVSEVKEVIDYINQNNIKKIFYEELSEGTVAKMISEETNAESSIFYTLHNVSSEEIENGEDYISYMKKNLEVLF